MIGALFPSYTSPPQHYFDRQKRALASAEPGRANIEHEKVFIAASIFDKSGTLANGPWAESILGLIDILGPANVYLSVFENDAGEEAEKALKVFAQKVECDHTITFDKHLNTYKIPHIKLPDGSQRVKRIAYLAEVRNRALKPLQFLKTRFDKILYINDVVFNPVDAAQLLFSTNVGDRGKASYRAACAVDFINPIKFYDTFATRDSNGYGVGLPFFPWFTSVGDGASRKDVLAGLDAVRVKSCWGGMVAFNATFFYPSSDTDHVPPTAGSVGPARMTSPYTFRAESDLYWDASECCLIHADIQNPDPSTSEIYLNPYVRVAYGKKTLAWLNFTRTFEKLYAPLHLILTKIVGMPWYNPRRAERAGGTVLETVWIPDPQSSKGGSFQQVERIAGHAGFCGRKALQVLKVDFKSGDKNWEFLPLPG